MALQKPTRTDLEHMVSSAAGSLIVASHRANEAMQNLIENVGTYGFEITSTGVKDFAEQILEVGVEDSQEWADSVVSFKQAVDAIYVLIFTANSGENANRLRRATIDR